MKTLMKAVYDELKYSEIVDNQTDFGAQLGYTKSYTSALIKTGAPLPNNVQNKVHEVFGVSLKFLASNGKEGKMFAREGSRVKTENINVNERLAEERENAILADSSNDQDYMHKSIYELSSANKDLAVSNKILSTVIGEMWEEMKAKSDYWQSKSEAS